MQTYGTDSLASQTVRGPGDELRVGNCTYSHVSFSFAMLDENCRLTHLLSEFALSAEVELLDDRVIGSTQHLHLGARHVMTRCHMRRSATTKGDRLGAHSLSS